MIRLCPARRGVCARPECLDGEDCAEQLAAVFTAVFRMSPVTPIVAEAAEPEAVLVAEPAPVFVHQARSWAEELEAEAAELSAAELGLTDPVAIRIRRRFVELPEDRPGYPPARTSPPVTGGDCEDPVFGGAVIEPPELETCAPDYREGRVSGSQGPTARRWRNMDPAERAALPLDASHYAKRPERRIGPAPVGKDPGFAVPCPDCGAERGSFCGSSGALVFCLYPLHPIRVALGRGPLGRGDYPWPSNELEHATAEAGRLRELIDSAAVALLEEADTLIDLTERALGADGPIDAPIEAPDLDQAFALARSAAALEACAGLCTAGPLPVALRERAARLITLSELV